MSAMSKKPWADTPLAPIQTPVFATSNHDLWTTGSSHMSNMHNAIFRGYNSIYQQALHVVDADKRDFISYCLAWHKFVTAHAENEETSLFIKVETVLDDTTIFAEAHEEHDAFKPGLQNFHDYLKTLKSPQDFSGTRLLSIMAEFQEVFEAHFRAEISTIAALAKHPKTPQAGSKEEAKVLGEINAKEGMALMTSGITDVVPFFLFNHDREYESGLWKYWPPIPMPVRWMIIRTATFMNSGCWRFASCDSNGQPRELYALAHPGPLGAAADK